MIFLTGATGLVGSYIARKLIEQNYKVRALKRKNSNLSLVQDIYSQIEWVQGDVLDILLLEDHLQGVDTIIHAAAMISFSGSLEEQMVKVNVNGTQNLINAALKLQIKQFCYISSVAALGRGTSNVIDELAKWEDSSNNTYYATSKYMAELEVWRGIEEGLNAVIVNPSVILGPGIINSGSTRIFNYILKEPYFYTLGEMNYIDVRDVTEIVVQLIQKNIYSERYILNAGKIPYKDLFSKIAKGFNKRMPPYKATPFMAEIAWRGEKVKSLLTGKEPLITKETARLSQMSHTFTNKKITEKLNFHFRDINDTIQWTCDVLTHKRHVGK